MSLLSIPSCAAAVESLCTSQQLICTGDGNAFEELHSLVEEIARLRTEVKRDGVARGGGSDHSLVCSTRVW